MLALKLFYQLDRALQRGLCSPQWHSHWAQPNTHEGFPLYIQAFASIAIVLMGVYPLSTDGQQGGSCLTQQQGKAVLRDHWHASVYLTALREILSMKDCL